MRKLFSCLVFVIFLGSCQHGGNISEPQQLLGQFTRYLDEDGISTYVDEHGKLRVETWMAFKGRVIVDNKIEYQSDTLRKVLLPKEYWDVMYVSKGKLSKTTTGCDGSVYYVFENNTDWTTYEGGYYYWITGASLCTIMYDWTFTTQYAAKYSFTNSVKMSTWIYDSWRDTDLGTCGNASQLVAEKISTFADQSYSAGYTFNQENHFEHNFEYRDCNTNELHWSLFELPSGGNSDSVTIDWRKHWIESE